MNCHPGAFVTHILDSLTSAFVILTIDVHFRLPGTEPKQNARKTLSFICVVQLFSLRGKQSEKGTKQAQALISIPFFLRVEANGNEKLPRGIEYR